MPTINHEASTPAPDSVRVKTQVYSESMTLPGGQIIPTEFSATSKKTVDQNGTRPEDAPLSPHKKKKRS